MTEPLIDPFPNTQPNSTTHSVPDVGRRLSPTEPVSRFSHAIIPSSARVTITPFGSTRLLHVASPEPTTRAHSLNSRTTDVSCWGPVTSPEPVSLLHVILRPLAVSKLVAPPVTVNCWLATPGYHSKPPSPPSLVQPPSAYLPPS